MFYAQSTIAVISQTDRRGGVGVSRGGRHRGWWGMVSCTKRPRLDCAALLHRVDKGQFSLVEDFSSASAGMGVHLKHGSFHVTRRARRARRESAVGETVPCPHSVSPGFLGQWLMDFTPDCLPANCETAS